MKKNISPYQCHIFVCVNDRKGSGKSCADGKSMEMKDALKEEVSKRGWKGKVRVSHSGCFGLCEEGPNVLLYPQGIWFSGVSIHDQEAILDEVAKNLF